MDVAGRKRARAEVALGLTALVGTVALLAGCGFNPQFAEGTISCRSEKDCPPAYTCRSSLCYSLSAARTDGASEVTGGGTGEAGGDGASGSGGDTGAGGVGAAGVAGAGTAGASGGAGGAAGSAGTAGGAAPPDGSGADAQPADGGCVDACTLDAHRCGTTGLETCVKVGGCTAWSTDVACSGHRTCQAVANDFKCACPVKPVGCDGGPGAVCANGMLRTCAADADGCIFEKSLDSCPTDKPCAGTFPTAACTCPAPPALCVGGAGTVCESSASVATCAVNADGCLDVSKHTTCPTGKPCTGSAPAATCSCSGAPTACAGQAGQFCAANGALSTCDLDANGCLAITNTGSCATGLTCQGAAPAASCQCPATPTACAGGIGATCNGTTQLLTCARDAHGCLYISAMMTCPTSKPCAGTLPSAACTCPATPTDCAAGTGTLCAAGKLETCGLDANGCVVLASSTSCPSGKPCGGSFPSASCMCPATPTGCGSGAGDSCSGTSVVACTTDVNGCYQTATSACPSGKPCGSSFPTASCMCPATPAGCSSGAGSSCSGNTLSTCSADVNQCLQATSMTCPSGEFCTGTFPNGGCSSPEVLGFSTDLGGMSKHSANQLLGISVAVTGSVTLRTFGLVSRTAADVTMALYKSDGTGAPSTLVASVVGEAVQTTNGGRNEYAVITQPTLTAGTYWIMAVFDADTQIGHDTTPASPTRYIAQTYSNPLPGTLGTTNLYTGTDMNFYILVLP